MHCNTIYVTDAHVTMYHELKINKDIINSKNHILYTKESLQFNFSKHLTPIIFFHLI